MSCATLFEMGDEQAHSVLQDLLLRFPDFVDGWRDLGKTLSKADQPEAAALAFQRAAKSSTDPMDHARLGAFLQTINRLGEAVASFRRALQAAPDLVEVRVALGSCLRQIGDLPAARVELERAINIQPGNGRAWFALGLICDDFRDTLGAIRAYQQSIDTMPDVPEAHVNLGLSLQNSGDLDAAMDAYRRAMRLRPDTFGRIAQALTSAKKGRLWLNLDRLRRSLEA